MKTLISIIFLIFTTYTISAQVTQEWVRTYNNSGSRGNDIVSDNSGNIYVVGYNTTTVSNSRILTIKYNSSGQEIWTRTNSNISFGLKIAVDNNQNIIVCGTERLNGVLDLIKYSSSGDTIWAQRYQRTPSISITPVNMKVDSDGSIFLTITTSIKGYDEYTILKYSSNGNLQWEHHYNYGFQYNNTANGIVLGSDSYFYVASFSFNSIGFIGLIIKYNKLSGDSVWSNRTINFVPKDLILDKQEMVYTTGDKDGKYYTKKINPEGVTLWNKIYDDSGGTAFRIGVDTSYNIYVSGSIYNKARITSIKYNTNGDNLWARSQYGASNTFCSLSSLLVEKSGDSYVGGSLSYIYPEQNYFTTKYNTDGNLIWTIKFSSAGVTRSFLSALTKDLDNNIIVTGSRDSSSYSGCTTIKYSQTVGISQTSSVVPEKFSLFQNYPNPFNPTTNLEIGIPASRGESKLGFVSLKIYDVLGNEVKTLVSSDLSPGFYKYEFDASGLPSGTYFYRLSANGFIETKKMLLLK